MTLQIINNDFSIDQNPATNRTARTIIGIICVLSSVAYGVVAIYRGMFGLGFDGWETLLFSSTLLLIGLLLISYKPRIVILLRKFRNDELNSVIDREIKNSIGRIWRLVTLDDYQLKPSGLRKRVFVIFFIGIAFSSIPAYQFLINFKNLSDIRILKISEPKSNIPSDPFQKWLLTPILPFLHMADASDKIDHEIKSLSNVFNFFQKIKYSIIEAFLLPFLVIAVVLIFIGFALISSHRKKFMLVTSQSEMLKVASKFDNKGRVVFSPRLTVIRVTNAIWQLLLIRLISISDVILIDVSIVTEDLLWEIEVTSGIHSLRRIYIGSNDSVIELVNSYEERRCSHLQSRLYELLTDCSILTYDSDNLKDIARFAICVRAQLKNY